MPFFTRTTDTQNTSADRVALVIGATGGVGQKSVDDLLEKGFRVIVVGRDRHKLGALAARMEQYENKIHTICADIQVTDDVRHIRDRIAEFGHLDLLILAAGITCNKTTGATEQEIHDVMNSNLLGPVFVINDLLPFLLRADAPLVICLSSRAGKIGFADKGIYGASKAGLQLYMAALSSEPALNKIRFTVLCPGWINTSMAIDGGCQRASDSILQPEDISSLMIWLVNSPERVRIKEIVIETSPVEH
ncbi:SDR family oxidoreductase [Kosakonia sp. S42]|uniref:SDR family NAD(P)-dependent oxidoreductase n=1 Tax=Kosakonia sp. S42 TaxID=2767458 RepID=UPI001909C906|nr:SDR family oxidoreductase [Kosakonia sp. S42]MBK0015670.1 SDR family oxidoreductase [Kosakonia sp. S42]